MAEGAGRELAAGALDLRNVWVEQVSAAWTLRRLLGDREEGSRGGVN